MASIQRKVIVVLHLSIVLIVSIGMTKSAAPENITYTCDENGVAELQDISDIQNFLIQSTGSDKGQFCRPSNSTLSSCDTISNKKHLIVVYDEESVNNIIGHDSKYYDLECTDNPSVVGIKATVFTVKSQTNNPVKETVNIAHVFELRLQKDSSNLQVGTPINIGDELKLQMIGIGVVISPLNCSAYPDNKKNEAITIWDFNTTGMEECVNNHTSIISGTKWTQINKSRHDIEIVLYAFRFVSSEKVQIECYASVCGIGNPASCSEKCITKVSRRRRRAASNGEINTRSSSTSFAIRINEDRANSSPGLSIGLTKFLLVALSLMCVYSA